MGVRMVIAAVLLGVPVPLLAQSAKPAAAPVPAAESRMLLEVTGGIGTTVVDVDAWAGIAANDWGTVAYSATGRLFFLTLGGGARVGAEAAYRYFFWYNYYPGTTTYPYQYDVTATQISGVVRFPMGARMSADVGAGMYVFEGGSEFGGHVALGYHLPLSPTMTLPVQVRADYVVTDPSLIPITVNAGIGFRL